VTARRDRFEERAAEALSLAKEAQRVGDERRVERKLDRAADWLTRANQA
jgi:hypothetical protein